MSSNPNHFDIAIIGSGIAGSALGSILARHKLRVIIFEAKSHPRFAIGESMILETSEIMRAMAEFFDVPELAYFSSENYFSHIGTSHGVKRHFSFLYHNQDQIAHNIHQSLQAVIPKQPHGHELHLYRQDSDYFMMTTAIAYGATVLQNTPVQDITPLPDKMEIITADGRKFEADYVVDAGGFRSILADKFNWRDHSLRTHSRAIFTHMVDVPCYHDVAASQKAYGLPFRVSTGTLHHVFDGGWLWVIPFNNHPRATNPLCSVGLMLDPRVYPQSATLSAEEEFFAILDQFPSMRVQFQSAKAVRDWTRTGRLQYSAKQVVGDRFCLLGHAAGFIDPLFSKGLYSSLMTTGLLAHLLLDAHRDGGDYAAARFQPLETLTLNYIRANDQLIANAYKAFGDYSLWSAYTVLWLLGAYTELIKLHSAHVQSANRAEYFDNVADLKLVGGGFAEFDHMTNTIDAIMAQIDLNNPAAVAVAAQALRNKLQEADWLPLPFRDVLAGKNHLPANKLKPRLLKRHDGFMGHGAYRRHFFGDRSMSDVMWAFMRDQVRYSAPMLTMKRRWDYNAHK